MFSYLNMNFDSSPCSFKCYNIRGFLGRFSQSFISKQVNLFQGEYLNLQLIWVFPALSHETALCNGKPEQIGIKTWVFLRSLKGINFYFFMTSDKIRRVSFSCIWKEMKSWGTLFPESLKAWSVNIFIFSECWRVNLENFWTCFQSQQHSSHRLEWRKYYAKAKFLMKFPPELTCFC